MYMEQKDLLWELDKDFVKKLMGVVRKESHEKGDVLFREGDQADHTYILIKGHVRLDIDSGETVYTVNHPGEFFGWSSIVGRGFYSAAAECMEPTIVQKINKEDVRKLIEKDPVNGLVFYRKVAEMLGNRLLHSYTMAAHQYRVPVSHGTGQLQELAEVA